MQAKNDIDPVHPGEILLEDYMKPLGLTVASLAYALRIPSRRISAIVRETRSITVDTAMRLGRYFSTSTEFWMNLQVFYEVRKAAANAKEIERQVQPLKAA